MAWSNPTSRSNGYVVPDTEWNKNTVDNPTALRAGEIAISGQAAEALIKASSATQLSTVTVPARGAVLYAGASGAPAWLAAGTSGYVLTAAGAGADPAWAANTTTPSLARDVAEIVINGDGEGTTETTVFSTTVSGGTLGSTKMIRLSLLGDYLNNSGGNRTIRVRGKLGTTTFFDSTAITVGSGATRGGVSLHSDISAKNATNAQVAVSRFWVGQQSGVAGSAQQITGGAGALYYAVHNAVAEDTTSDKTLSVTVELGNTDSTLDVTVRTVQVELI